MRRTRSLTLLLAATAATFALAACGGDDDGGSDDADITDAIERAATENEPENCTEVQTVAFNEQTQFETGDAAVEAPYETASA